MPDTLLRTESLRVTIAGKEILRDISLEIKTTEQWAVFGEAGTGKTVLAHTLAGNHVFRGKIDFPDPEEKAEKKVLVIDQQHRFRNLQNQTNFYYQQRYNAFDSEATITVAQDLASLTEIYTPPLSREALLEAFHMTPLLDEPLIQLSNGENKRLQILKAILCQPHLLILDEPFTGLDHEGRGLLAGILSLLADSGQPMLLLSSRNFMPSCFNRFARLENGKLELKKNGEEIRISAPAPIRMESRPIPALGSFSYPDFRYAVRMRNVSVRYEGRNILDDINWDVEKGSCWALTGANGAGKSTLLSLITADNPQAYAKDIFLFDRKRGSGESIWEIKQKIGYLSPELQLYFDPAATAFTTIASGLFDTIGLFRQLSLIQEEMVWEWLQFLECTAYAHRLLSSLPAGIQRMVLLGRAMIKKPPLLILDEPCQGLDFRQTKFILEMINHNCTQREAGLIFVSHYRDEFPACIGHELRLEKGKIV